MAVGLPLKTTYADGDVYSASDVNDTNGTINITAAPYAAGKNKIINGDFGVWQRGTSYTLSAVSTYGAADRFRYWHNGSTVGTNTVSQETFTPGSAPVAGYESQFFQRATTTTLGTSQTVFDSWQRVENVRTFAGQPITFSVWAKSSGSRNLSLAVTQNFGSGGSTAVSTTIMAATATTTGWVRYSGTITMPSVSGKTIGSGSYLNMEIRFSGVVAGDTFDIWGVQLESGQTSTAFQTASGTIGGELALCQRYYYRSTGGSTYSGYAVGFASTTTIFESFFTLPVTMRIEPTSVDFANLAINVPGVAVYAVTAAAINSLSSGPNYVGIDATSSTLTALRPGFLCNNNNVNGYLGVSAEL